MLSAITLSVRASMAYRQLSSIVNIAITDGSDGIQRF